MTTALQAQSNARNAQRSTGPVTAEGKARCAQNARRHGFCAADIVMPGQDDAPFHALLAETLEQWQPEGGPQRELAEEIAVAIWRRWLLRRAEGELWAVRCGSGPDALEHLGQAIAGDCDTTANAIEKLRRWWQGNERHLHRCIDRLALMQRLAAAGGTRRPPGGERGFARFLDAAVNRPLPGERPDGTFPRAPESTAPADEIGNSPEQTQSTHVEPEQGLAEDVGAPETGVSEGGAPARNRKERRRLERAQRKRERRLAG